MLCSLFLGCSCLSLVNAQTTKDSSLQITGSADIYYNYDFAQSKNPSVGAADALMGTKPNSIDFGMLDLQVKKDLGKSSIFAELAFGPRADGPKDASPSAYYLQNLYFTYKVQKQLSVTAGIMYRYDMYERLTAVDNFNYLASNAYRESRKIPSRSVGVKANYSFNDKVSASLGLFNTINNQTPNSTDNVTSTPDFGLSDVVAQLYVNPTNNLKLSAAIWKEGQKNNGTHENIQAHYQVNKGLYLGLDFNNYSGMDSATQAINACNNFTSVGLYVQKNITGLFSLGARLEHQQTEQNTVSNFYVKENYNILTLTGKETFGALSLKQELKYDLTDGSNVNTPYVDKSGNPTKNDVQIVLAAVFAF